MEVKKILVIIFGIIFTGALIFSITWGVINFNKVKEGMSGSGLYNEEDIKNSYEDGYNTALKNKEEYEVLINTYRDTITTLNDNISRLNSQVTILTNSNKDYDVQVKVLKAQEVILNSTIAELQSASESSAATIKGLNTQIRNLNTQIETLTLSGENKAEQITLLTSQVASLRSIKAQLEETNASNLVTINSLNGQVVKLNEDIVKLNASSQTSSNVIATLNGQVAQLQDSVSYYEQLLEAFQDENKVIATFKLDGLMYNVQVVTKNGKVIISDPTTTEYMEFKGWSLDGKTAIDLSTYILTDNTTFVALVEFKYDVKYISENTLLNTIKVKSGEKPTSYVLESTTHKEFKGWSLDGSVIVDPTTQIVNNSVTYTAIWHYSYDVDFRVDGVSVGTQIVKSGEKAIRPTEPLKDGYLCSGWTLNGIDIVDFDVFIVNSNIKLEATFKERAIAEKELNDFLIPFKAEVMKAYPNIESLSFEGRLRMTGDYYLVFSSGENKYFIGIERLKPSSGESNWPLFANTQSEIFNSHYRYAKTLLFHEILKDYGPGKVLEIENDVRIVNTAAIYSSDLFNEVDKSQVKVYILPRFIGEDNVTFYYLMLINGEIYNFMFDISFVGDITEELIAQSYDYMFCGGSRPAGYEYWRIGTSGISVFKF